MSSRAHGRRYALGALLALGLLVAHLFLMTHEPRHGQHLAHDAGEDVATMAEAMLTAMPAAPAMPSSVLDGCPVAQATLPGLVFLLLLVVALCTRMWSFPATTAAQPWLRLLRTPPAPPPPARRRALLQVFLI